MLAIGCDHAGYPLKEQLLPILHELCGGDVLDVGTHSLDSVDFPDYADKVAGEVLSGRCDKGILICGTGIGISIAANRHKGIRCALCNDVYSARMTRLHNDANVLAMGGRVIGIGTAEDIVAMFLRTDFEGGRHQRRIDMLDRQGEMD